MGIQVLNFLANSDHQFVEAGSRRMILSHVPRPPFLQLLLRGVCRSVNPDSGHSHLPKLILKYFHRIQLESVESERCFPRGIATIAEQPAFHPDWATVTHCTALEPSVPPHLPAHAQRSPIATHRAKVRGPPLGRLTASLHRQKD